MKILRMTGIRYIVLTLIVLALGFYLVVLGGPIKRTVRLGSCSISYNHYLTNNAYCNWKTAGHCATNDITLANAKRLVGKCICENEVGEELNNLLFELVNSDPILMRSFKERSRGRFDQDHINIDSMKLICEFKDEIFELLRIE